MSRTKSQKARRRASEQAVHDTKRVPAPCAHDWEIAGSRGARCLRCGAVCAVKKVGDRYVISSLVALVSR